MKSFQTNFLLPAKQLQEKSHFDTFIWAPNTQIEDMFINTVCCRSHDTLNGGRSGLMQ